MKKKKIAYWVDLTIGSVEFGSYREAETYCSENGISSKNIFEDYKF